MIAIAWGKMKTELSANEWDLYYVGKIEDFIGEHYKVYTGTYADQFISVLRGSDLTDFETNYKSDATECDTENDFLNHLKSLRVSAPFDEYGKNYVRSESRPVNCTTWFTMRGDKTTTPKEIGGGKELCWDFSNTDDDVSSPPSGTKRKRLEFQFIDSVWVKEGTIYFFDAPKDCYIDFYIVCPNGQYYKKNDGTLAQATADTIIHSHVIGHRMVGDCPMGDELNTETSSAEIPNNYKFWIDITTPDTDSISYGHVSVEIYRTRTVILE